jgi:hypothetical protein
MRAGRSRWASTALTVAGIEEDTQESPKDEALRRYSLRLGRLLERLKIDLANEVADLIHDLEPNEPANAAGSILRIETQMGKQKPPSRKPQPNPVSGAAKKPTRAETNKEAGDQKEVVGRRRPRRVPPLSPVRQRRQAFDTRQEVCCNRRGLCRNMARCPPLRVTTGPTEDVLTPDS